MLLSMTGFGQAHRETDHYAATVELRSLNSKTLDLSLRLPRFLQAHELDIRQQISKALLRGKINFSLDYTRAASAAAAPAVVNAEALAAAFEQLKVAASQLGIQAGEDTFLAALRLPGVVPTTTEAQQADTTLEPTWAELQPLLTQALAAMQQFRHDEGQTLQREILGYVATIRQQLAAVELHDPQRIEHVRQRLVCGLVVPL
jgi:uncharacterized protein (TIGR00255 family)